jgi:peptidyl-prolyl cis-trans isomerase C
VKSARIALLAALAIAGVSAGTMAARADDAVVAKIDGNEIKESDLKLAEAEVGPQLASLPPEKQRRILLEFLIEMQLFADAAEADKLTTGPDYEKSLAYWTMRAKRDAYFQKKIKESVGEGLVRGIYDDRVKMIPAEEEVSARHILVETEVSANDVYAKVEKGEDFGKLAEEFSRDPGSKADGGKLGYFTKEQMVKEFSDAAFGLKAGEVSKPVKSKFGWHIIKVDDKRTKPLPTFEEVKGQIIDTMVQQKGQQAATDLRGKAKIEYVDAQIAEEVRKETALNAAKKKMMDDQLGEQIKQMEESGAAKESDKDKQPEKKE